MRWVRIFNRILCRWEWISIPLGIKVAAFTGIGLCAGMVPLFWPSAPLPPPVVAAPSPGVVGPFPPAWGARPMVPMDGAYGPGVWRGGDALIHSPLLIIECIMVQKKDTDIPPSWACGYFPPECERDAVCTRANGDMIINIPRPTPEPGGLFAVGLAMMWVVRWMKQSR